MKNFLLLLAFVAGTITFSSAQNFTPCLTDELYQRAVIENPELIKIEEKANDMARAQMASILSMKKAGLRVIPVVFHIIHQNGPENISQAQIMDQIRILNEDYRKKTGTNGGASTDPLAADMEVEFRLAQYDPSGNKHDGINRVESALSVNADDNVKSVSYWDNNRYLNVWVVSSIASITGVSGTVLGYAQFPTQKSSRPLTDGIVIRSDQVGIIGSGQVSQAGRTLTHEIGHWLGLYHPFQNGCVGASSTTCSSQGDQVCDTPPVASANYGCSSKNSCTNDVPDLPDQIKNYMDYADGTCMNMFTTGQKTRVYGISFGGANYRGNISSVTNLNTTGIDGTGAYLTVNSAPKKAPYSYDFENSSAVVDGWVLNNFNTPANGFQVSTMAAQSGGKSMSIHNFGNGGTPINSRNGFQSPEIDLTTIPNPYVNFYYAYAQKSNANNDIVNLTISGNFGMEEINIFSGIGSLMATAPDQTTDFVPSAGDWKAVSVSLAAYKAMTNARFRFEFQNRFGNNMYIDNFSITNGIVSGTEEMAKAALRFNVFPNPMSEQATVSFDLARSNRVRIQVLDIIGREVQVPVDAILDGGEHKVNVNKNNLKTGVYFIRFSAGENVFVHKLLIN